MVARHYAFAILNTFRETHHILVKDGSKIIDQLNELEFIKGEIYANVWHSDMIARISPRDGHVIAWIDLTGLLPSNQIDAESVLKRNRLRSAARPALRREAVATVFEIKVIQRTSEKQHS